MSLSTCGGGGCYWAGGLLALDHSGLVTDGNLTWEQASWGGVGRGRPLWEGTVPGGPPLRGESPSSVTDGTAEPRL